jgi:hypothetical protein
MSELLSRSVRAYQEAVELISSERDALRADVERLKQTLRDSHHIVCNHPAQVIGGPGCVCIPVNKHEQKQLKSDLAEAVEIITGCIGSLEYVDRNHKNVTGYGVREQRIAEANSFLARMEVKP